MRLLIVVLVLQQESLVIVRGGEEEKDDNYNEIRGRNKIRNTIHDEDDDVSAS